MVIKRVHFTSFTLQTNSIMPFGPIKTTLAVVGASIFSYYSISPAAKALFRKNDGEGDGNGGKFEKVGTGLHALQNKSPINKQRRVGLRAAFVRWRLQQARGAKPVQVQELEEVLTPEAVRK